jgi:hypothetical protein
MTLKQLSQSRQSVAAGERSLSLQKVLAKRAKWASQGFELPPLNYTATSQRTEPRNTPTPRPVSKSTVGTALKKIIKRAVPNSIPCTSCVQLITELDSMTADEVAEQKGWIVDDIHERAPTNAPTMWRVMLAFDAAFADGAFAKARIGKWVDEAIANSKLRSSRVPAKATKAVSANQLRIKGHRSTNKEQDALHKIAVTHPPSVPSPFATPPVFNLVWHIWPIHGTWKWHVDRLNELLRNVHGQVIIGIATDENTDDPEEVKARFERKDIIFLVNKNVTIQGMDIKHRGRQFGELVTAIPAFKMLDASQDTITIYGHAKGARPHTRTSEAVRIWTETMYETVSFNLEKTVEVLEAGYNVLGSFRTFGTNPLQTQHKYHFSGTFYNFRTRILSSGRKFQLRYGGTECWPGDHIPATKAWCEFRDNSPLLFQYNDSLIHHVVAEQLHWESDRFGIGPKMEQHKREFDWLIEQLADCKSLLVIGSRHGGMEYHIAKRLPALGENITSIDIDPLPGNVAPDLMRGSSANPDVQRYMRDNYGSFDAVFIDGDHLEAGVRLDWEFAKTLYPKRVFFHDFTNALYHRLHECEVHRVVPEIRSEALANNWQVSEKAVGCGWGGILQVVMGASS